MSAKISILYNVYIYIFDGMFSMNHYLPKKKRPTSRVALPLDIPVSVHKKLIMRIQWRQ